MTLNIFSVFFVCVYNLGVQVELAQCSSLFIAPMAYKRTFSVVSQEIPYDTSEGKRSTIGGVCKIFPFNEASSGVFIDVILYEGGGVGWIGAYYSIHPYHPSSSLLGQFDE